MSKESITNANQVKRGAVRPRGVTILLWLVLILAVFHLTRFQQSILRWEFLQVHLPFSPVYLAISGIFWGLVGLFMAWAIWVKQPWTPKTVTAASLLASLNYWLERIFLARSPDRNINWQFVVVVNALILVFIFFQLRQDKVVRYFGEKHDK